MDATCSSETSVEFQRSKQNDITEDKTLQIQHESAVDAHVLMESKSRSKAEKHEHAIGPQPSFVSSSKYFHKLLK
jgi:hypothetical protein